MRPSYFQTGLCRTALSAALFAALGTPASALVLVGGSWSTSDNVPVGPGNSSLPTKGLYLGNGAVGNLQVDGGSQLQVASLVFGRGQTGTGTGMLSGAGSRIELAGNGFDQGSVNRFEVGGWGSGNFTVANGALLDGRFNSAACLGLNHYCNTFIGNAAGSSAIFTVAGAGSQAQFLRFFGVGGVAVFHPPIDSFTFGTPAGTTSGTVNVLAGGTLVTDNANLGLAPGGGSPTGNERSFAATTISGAGSLWRVTGGTLEPGQYARFHTALHRNAWATVTVANGGELRLEGDGNAYTAMNLTNGGGRTDLLVTGPGSRVRFQGASGVLNIANSGNGTAFVDIRDGGVVDGLFYAAVGRSGGTASVFIDGAGSLLRVDGTATAAANVTSSLAAIDIGRNGGNGTVTVANGGRLEMLAHSGAAGGMGFNLGRDANSAGTLNIGAGGEVLLRSTSSAPGTAQETWNPFMRVGRDGNGTLAISGGGKLLLEGGGVSTPVNRRSTSLFIGGSGDATVGGKGVATVTGAGSQIRLSGTDTFIGVGIGPQASGQLNVLDRAEVSGIGMNVGRSGGVGVLKVDNATLSFSGQQTAGNLAGAFLSIGNGGGIGVATFDQGSVVTLTNAGSAGVSLSLGGTGGAITPFPGGDGNLTLAGGSRISLVAAPGLASVNVAREGSALVRVRGGSSIDVGDGNLTIARNSGSDGTVLVSEGSSIVAGWVGVGARRTTTGDTDGGTGTFVLVNSTLNAGQIVIGTNGFLGGTGIINGMVTNRGIFAPGNSPGRLEINGGFAAAAGSRLILEVQDDGQGGFLTDELVFNTGQPLDLSALKVEFRFLGNTDPNAFQTSGRFDVDTFFQLKAADGSVGGLAPAQFASTTFSATAEAYTVSNFSFDAVAGAQFTAQPVPEPATWAMLLAGLAGLGQLARRRRLA